MKKFMMFLVMVASVVMLTACSSGSSVKSIDGEYYEFYTSKNTSELVINNVDYLEVLDNTIKTWDGEYLIDKEKQVVEVDNGQVKSYTVDSETGVITFDEKTYVKVGSEYYQKLIDDGAKE